MGGERVVYRRRVLCLQTAALDWRRWFRTRGKQPLDKEHHPVLPIMPLLAKKMNHGTPLFLPYPVIDAKAFLQSKGTCRLIDEASARSSHRLRTHLILLYYVEELKPLKTAWEYYNEGMYASTSRYIV